MSSVTEHATNISATVKEHFKGTLNDFYTHMNRLMYWSLCSKDDAPTSGMLMPGSIVETNNFQQVIKLFNDCGKLKNKNTRLAIECQICVCKNLAIINHHIDKPNNEEHERYVVLPRCGHAFGSSCLQQVSRHPASTSFTHDHKPRRS
ncbi:hypothetical protein F5Y08DRAFT_308443 [Xylaria arbuscula]|nr:hypothetical protein F5Y08DRAFT_308443 [Xylaria arbuscula]